jgi:hypothetical protein
MARAVHNRLPTEMTRVRSHVRSYGICGGVSGTESSTVLPIVLCSTAPHSTELPDLNYIQSLDTDTVSRNSLKTGLKRGDSYEYVLQESGLNIGPIRLACVRPGNSNCPRLTPTATALV